MKALHRRSRYIHFTAKRCEASLKLNAPLFDAAGALQLCGVCVQLGRGQSAALALAPQHLQSAVESLSDRAVQRGPVPHRVQAQLGAAGAQQGEDRASQLLKQHRD